MHTADTDKTCPNKASTVVERKAAYVCRRNGISVNW